MSDVARRNKRNRRNGTFWESTIRDGLREEGFDYEKLRLAGQEDEGDGVVRDSRVVLDRVVVEAKAGKLEAAQFVREAAAEARNYEKHRGLPKGSATGVAIVKQRGKNWKDGYVLTSVREFFGLDS